MGSRDFEKRPVLIIALGRCAARRGKMVAKRGWCPLLHYAVLLREGAKLSKKSKTSLLEIGRSAEKHSFFK